MKLFFSILILLCFQPAYSMEWSYKTYKSKAEESKKSWTPIKDGKPLIEREYEGYIEYRTSFKTDSQIEDLGIYLGKIGDVDKVYVNDVLIGQTGDFPPNYTYKMDVERQYFIPSSILRNNTQNELKVTVYVKFLVNKGLDVRNVMVGNNSDLHHKKYVTELVDYLSKIIIPLLCLILAAISFPALAPKVLWRDQVLISLIGISSFILGLCRSRICYHFFEMVSVYKLTLVSSVATLWLILIYSIGTTGKYHKRLTAIGTIVTALLISLISLQDNLIQTAGIGKIWFHVAPFFTLTSLCCVFFKQAKNIALKLGLIILFLTNLNDNLNDLRIIFTFPMLQIGLGSFISLLILNQTVRLKKSWESFFKKEVELEADARLGRQSLQLAHDIRSPLEALKSTQQTLSLIPNEERALILMSMKRIEAIAENLLETRKEERDEEEKKEDIKSSLELVISEKRLQYRSYEELMIKLEANDLCPKLYTSMGQNQFKRVISNLITNSAEAMRFEGTITIRLVSEMNSILIEVTDTGSGFDERFKEDFFRSGFTTKKNGNGLGLNHAKNEIETIGGTIKISNEKGAVVQIVLPKLADATDQSPRKIVLIDDDELTRLAWKRRGIKNNIVVSTFNCVDDFLDQSHLFPKNVEIYVDSILSENLRGEIESKRISDLGFTEISIASGLSEDQILKPKWIKKIVGKSSSETLSFA